MPKFFGYSEILIRECKKKGFSVSIIYENFNEFVIKYKFGFNNAKEYNKYYVSKMEETTYDIVLAIRASTLSCDVIDFIKKNSPNAKMYMYQWDSVANNPNAIKIAHKFDVVMTFDPYDAKKYGWEYRPLFYTEWSLRRDRRQIDIAYICSLHSKRVNVFNTLKEYNNYKEYLYLYSKLSHYIKEKYLKHATEYQEISDRDVHFKPLSLSQVNEVMRSCNIIVDYTHPQQKGFTMRTCEAIGHHCKLATNNIEVLKADFYDPNNVYIYDPENFVLPKDFIQCDYRDLEESVYNRYSVNSWVSEILHIEE